MSVHHVCIEVRRDRIVEERLMWSLLGFNPTGLPHRGRRNVHWLVNKVDQMAVHLHESTQPSVPGIGHLALKERDWERTVRLLRAFRFPVEDAADYFGNRRCYIESPTGYYVELLSGSPSINAFLPLEGS